MTNVLPWLLLGVLVIPVATAVAAAVLGPRRGEAIRWISLAATVITLVLAAIIATAFAVGRAAETKPAPPSTFHPEMDTFHPEMVTQWNMLSLERLVPSGGREAKQREPAAIQFYVGIDGINVWLVLLTAVLMVSSVLVSWTAITERVNEYYALLLALQTALVGVFVSFDIVLFYVFFELTLVPLFFLIGIWGGPQRQHAARKFFIYTLTGSLITLLGVLGVVLASYSKSEVLTFSIPQLVENVHQQYWVQIAVFLALMAGFAIKVPLVPLHTWLPLAHVEAPTAGSVILAGVLLKIGTYGFLRLCLPLAPDASLHLGVPLVGTLAVIGVIYGAFCALAQDDIKRLVAYSSVSHLGFCMLGMFALNVAGLSGSLLQMINHGLSTGTLFLLVGMLYERYHTRKLADYGGMGARLGLLTCFMVFICLTSIGLPGLNGFIGEALVLLGIYSLQDAPVNGITLGVLGATGIVLGAWYLLTLLRRVFFGAVKEPHHEGQAPVGDLNLRELAALVPIAVLCVAIGVYPQPLLRSIEPDLKLVEKLVHRSQARVSETQQQAAQAGEDNETSR